MAEVLGEYNKDIHMRKVGARKAFADFRASRGEMVKRILEVNGLFLSTGYLDPSLRNRSKCRSATIGHVKIFYSDTENLMNEGQGGLKRLFALFFQSQCL
jgi:hypothetical protein